MLSGARLRIALNIWNQRLVPWEYRLTAELVLDGIQPIKQAYADLTLFRMKASTCLEPKQCSQFVHEKLNQLIEWIEYTRQIFDKELNESWGPPGVEGNRTDIEVATSKLLSALWALHDWEKSVASVVPDRAWDGVFQKLRLSTKMWINDIESFFLDFKKLLSDPEVSGQRILEFVIKAPKQLVEAQKDIRKAEQTSLPKSEWGNRGGPHH